VKEDVKSKVAAKNDCDGRLIAKSLITAIQLNLCCLPHVSLQFGTKFTRIVVIKIFAISLPSQPFLAATLDSHLFSQWPFLGATHYFLQLGYFWIRFYFFLQLYSMLQSWHIAINSCCYLSSFLCRQIYPVLYMCIMYIFF